MPNPNPKSVLISGGNLQRGGARTHLCSLVKLLRESEVSVSLLATGSNWTLEEIEATQALGVQFLTPPKLLVSSSISGRFYSTLIAPLQRRKPYTSFYAISTGRSHLYLRNWLRPSTVGIYHELVSTPTPGSLGWKCAASIGTIVANSEKIGSEMSALFPETAIRVIPFLTTDQPMPIPKARPAVGTRPLKVVYLGRLVSHKRANQLVKEWAKISALAPLAPAELDVYGYDPTGDMLTELKDFVADQALSEQIRLHGNYEVSDLPQILEQADVVVLPSLKEGLPLVLVEAMQRGVTIVATAAGGTEELGHDNPDVIITDIEWDDFVRGLLTISGKLRSGQIDSIRLHHWTEQRYGYESVSKRWLQALLTPQDFFNRAIPKPLFDSSCL